MNELVIHVVGISGLLQQVWCSLKEGYQACKLGRIYNS